MTGNSRSFRLIGDYVATMDAAAALHAPGYIDVAGGRITGAGSLAGAPTPDGLEVHNVGGLLLPGLLNGHAHSPMTLLRGAGEGLPLDRWLNEAIWPQESRLEPADVGVGMALGAAEMLVNGVTTTHDMYFFPADMAEAAAAVGMRAIISAAVIEGLERFGTPEQQLVGAMNLQEAWRGRPLIEIGLGPHSAYVLGDATLRQVRDAALETGMPIHIHVAETRTEGDALFDRTGKTVPQHLEELGFLETRLVAAHCVWLSDDDMAILAAHGVGAAHCPSSNGKLASGIAPVAAMRRSGIPVSISTDGPASNDNLDVLREARQAILYARLKGSDARALQVADALRMVTSEAAAALGRSDIGAIEPGRQADIVRVSLDRPEYEPVLAPEDILARLVWSGSARDVTDVWVGGEHVVADGSPANVDMAELRARAAEVASRISA